VVNIQESNKDRDNALLLDISKAGNSAQACQLADEFMLHLSEGATGLLVDINAGDLLLTRGVLTKLKQQIQRVGAILGTMYATVPQTQQAALDEGLYVKEKLLGEWAPIRQALPLKGNSPRSAERPAQLATGGEPSRGAGQVKPGEVKMGSGVNLPDFSQLRAALPTEAQFEAVAPQSLDIPELPEPQMEESVELVESLTYETTRVEESATFTQEVTYTETAFDTLYLRQTLRSGQTVRFKGHVIIVGDVHAGSEITAGGDIVVWGELRGIAHAGAQGNYKSEIRAMKIEALQLRIADYIARRPDRIYYHKDGAEHASSPEVARVADAEIKIFKTMLPKG
jgi:septum site-determining protein MinC